MLHLPWPHKHGSWFSPACSSAETYLFEHRWDGENFVSISSSIPPKQKIPWEHVQGIQNVRSSIHPISIPSEKKKKKLHNSTCPSCPEPIFPEFSQSEKSPVRQVLGIPGAPGRRALLLLHLLGGLLGHLQVRLEAGAGDFLVDLMMDYDMI